MSRKTRRVKTSAERYAEAAPLHGACGMKHYEVDECDRTARVARRCPFVGCVSRPKTKLAYDRHVQNRHGYLPADLVRVYVDSKERRKTEARRSKGLGAP